MPKSVDSGKDSRLDREEWLSKAMEVLATEGQAGLRIQGLCDKLSVSRGSFYWHFKDRDDFKHAMLEYWHDEYTAPIPDWVESEGGTPEERLDRLIRAVHDRDGTRYDMAVRSWAVQDPSIARLVRKTDKYRLDYLRSLFSAMGFTGNELEIRTRACLSYITLEKGLFERVNRKKRAEMLETLHSFLVRK